MEFISYFFYEFRNEFILKKSIIKIKDRRISFLLQTYFHFFQVPFADALNFNWTHFINVLMRLERENIRVLFRFTLARQCWKVITLILKVSPLQLSDVMGPNCF
jgi:hypothetical protein